jgi:hypothetical protein
VTIASYSELVTEIGAWLNRSDLSARIPTFIRLFEARMNRRLRDPDMEAVGSIALVTGTEGYDLPFGFREARLAYMDAAPRIYLTPMTPQSLRSEFTGQESGNPEAYAIIEGQIVLAPAPTSDATLKLVYYRELTGIDTGNATNWLLDAHPDCYLFGSLCTASAYLVDDERLNVWKAAWDEAIEEIMQDGNKRRLPGGPLVARSEFFE